TLRSSCATIALQQKGGAMTASLRIAGLGLALMLAPAATFAQKVSYDFDRSADFSKIRTFGFREGTTSDNPLIDQRLVATITSVLSQKGLLRDDPNPDMTIDARLTFNQRSEVLPYGPAYGYRGWYWGGLWGPPYASVRDVTMGTLVIDMIDSDNARLIWGGTGVSEGEWELKGEKIDKVVNKTVTKILKDFPPFEEAS